MKRHRSTNGFFSFHFFPLFALLLATTVTRTDAAIPDAAEHWLVLSGGTVSVGIDDNLTLNIYQGTSEELIWRSLTTSPPTASILHEDSDTPLAYKLSAASQRKVGSFDDGSHRGHRIQLQGFDNTDAQLELILAIDQHGELLVEVEQTGGTSIVHSISGLYDWQIKPSPDSYALVPRGSGYMIRADSQQPVEVSGLIGAAHSLPVFALVRGDRTLYQIVETWWDAAVSLNHVPNDQTVLAMQWSASLGRLNYRRRGLWRFVDKLDHVGIAKAYRSYLIKHHAFRTLQKRVEQLPKLKTYLEGIEYRWVHWQEGQTKEIIDNIRNFQQAGLPVTFFYPKWPSQGMEISENFDAGWQGFVHPSPVPGGWPAANKLLDAVHQEGCAVKRMLTPHYMYEDAPDYDPKKLSGVGFPRLSTRYAEWMIHHVYDFLEKQDFHCDAIYFDGNSAHRGYDEHRGGGNPVSRRDNYESQLVQFRETRRRGMIPGAELARFWSIAECDFFFFTDWSSDRLRHGEPVPWVPLVFHDCYGAHFSGGGYYNEGKYDWYEERHPRLYELMYSAVPSHNWLPGGSQPINPQDWGTDKMNRRLAWLKRWHTYYQAVCYREMTNHQFLNASRSLQRIEFAGGIIADFDLVKGQFRVQGIDGFTGDWETPETIER